MKKRFLAFAGVLLAGSSMAQVSGGSSQLQSALGKGMLPFLLACFAGGLVALLTPCVFPMVPVTVSFFAKRKDKPLASALIYALGIISTFAILGIVAASLFGAAGIARFAANPWVNVGLAVLFVVLALNLFGVYEFRIGLAGKLENAARKKSDSLISPFLVGMAFSLTSFTCTGPIVAALLAMAAQSGGKGTAAIGMSAFGLAFSLPFFFLALFPAGLGKLPKSGQWLGAVKPALGFIELAAALKFLSNADLSWQLGLLTRPIFVGIWGVLCLMLAIYLISGNWLLLWVKSYFSKGNRKAVTFNNSQIGLVRQGLGIVALVSAFLLLISPHGGQQLSLIDAYLPNDPYPYKSAQPVGTAQYASNQKTNQASSGPVEFLSDYNKALALAKSQGRPVFVDFTGVTCTNCRWMEQNVFTVPQIREALGQMVTVQLYTDRGTAVDNANQDLEQKIGGTIALPVYAIVTPDGKVIKTFEGRSNTVEQFAEFLKAAGSVSST